LTRRVGLIARVSPIGRLLVRVLSSASGRRSIGVLDIHVHGGGHGALQFNTSAPVSTWK
jgi:hypothetical protein